MNKLRDVYIYVSVITDVDNIHGYVYKCEMCMHVSINLLFLIHALSTKFYLKFNVKF